MASLALCVICKNEKPNLPRLLESVRDCFHEIHVVDTGSTDGTVELLEEYKQENPAQSPLFVHHFEWINDFSAARNFAFQTAKTDYIMWMDLDDVMQGREEFISWRDSIMDTAECWFATYHYGGFDANGNSPCKFLRERVIRNNGKFEWRYFVHEGLIPKEGVSTNYAVSWSIVHQRSQEDITKDRSRNINLFANQKNLDARMRYYYGKELFENQQPMKAYGELVAASADPKLEPHDRTMALQYAVLSAIQCNQLAEAFHIAYQGLELNPDRSEFHILIADCLIKQNRFAEAIPYLSAAKACNKGMNPIGRAEPIYRQADLTGHYPRNMLARCYFQLNRTEEARQVLKEALAIGPNLETMQLLNEMDRIEQTIKIRPVSEYKQTPDIVITCLPNVVKDWDEDTLKTKGLGGSETAVIHMARQLAEHSGRTIYVFNDRKTDWFREGVHYQPLSKMYEYFKEFTPALHVAWRHNVKLTAAPTYLWCHDLAFLGLDQAQEFQKILALSEFHQNWLHHVYSVPRDKIIITKNGIDPKRFQGFEELTKNPKKVIYSSSPDRGLERVLAVMDIVTQRIPDTELHVYYGMDNMRAMGLGEKADFYQRIMSERSYVKYHGNVSQEELTREFEEAAVWLYPTDFLETYCITAIEALCAGVYPVVRHCGALPDTLGIAAAAGMASILKSDYPHEFAEEVILAIQTEKWRCVKADPKTFSWSHVAKDWLSTFEPLTVK